VGLALLLSAQASFGAIVPAETVVGARQFDHPGLTINTDTVAASPSDLGALAISPSLAQIDPATGRFATLLPTQPLIPGDGVGNSLTWGDLLRAAPSDEDGVSDAAGDAFVQYLTNLSAELKLSPAEFGDLNVSVIDNTILLHVQREVGGIPVRDSFITGTMSHGNLILMGAARWADMNVSPVPSLDEAAARQSLNSILSNLPVEGSWGDTELTIVPFEEGAQLGYRLAYSLKPSFDNELGNFEGLVDAHTGELLSFRDTNHYATRHVVGGVYPESNDGVGPEGTEQLGWPMPYADLGSRFTDGNGNFPGEYTGPASTSLDGLYITMDDNCGNIDESSNGTDDIDFGGSGGDDCTTPPGASPGNTHSSRTGFYELNRVAEWARTRVPFSWLSDQLEANMNINSVCNAFWSGTVNFYRSGGGCGNTGELAGVFDHEWGHGLDDNDNNPNISNPGEGIADLYAALRLDTSCIGRGFFDNGQCTGYGDPCLDCDGIRDVDWANRASGEPHDVAWSNANCSGIVHCKGAVYSESVWDLKNRDLPTRYGMDNNTALELTTRLTLVGASNVGRWFTDTADGEDGCAAEAGYMNYIAADDVDGDLTNGTPHMSAIFAAFNRHGAACSTPAVQDAGCDGAPTEAPNVTASAGDSSVSLSWGPVAGATSYHVYRTDGVKQCDKGKIYLGRTSDTSFTSDGLLNGHEYYYTVHANAGGRSCLGPMSSCTAATPN